MKKYPTLAGLIGICLSMQPLTEATAAVYAERPFARSVSQVTPIQFAPDRRHGGPGMRAHPGWRGGPNWRGGPGWRGAAHWRGPSGWSGRPYWYGRPWVRRPYYGTIIAGVALGTIVTVAAVGMVPRRPAPDLCWYWADPYGNRGYWDYC